MVSVTTLAKYTDEANGDLGNVKTSSPYQVDGLATARSADRLSVLIFMTPISKILDCDIFSRYIIIISSYTVSLRLALFFIRSKEARIICRHLYERVHKTSYVLLHLGYPPSHATPRLARSTRCFGLASSAIAVDHGVKMACPITRKYPPKQPPSWKPPVPRWQLHFPDDIAEVHTLYVGVQSHTSPNPALESAIAAVRSAISSTNPVVINSFLTETTLGHDIPSSRVWVAYYTSASAFDAALTTLSLTDLYTQHGSTIGLWTESFTTPLPRLETNYALLHEAPGLASIPNTTRDYHELSAYWGAARDRIPASAEDLFAVPGTPIPEAAKTSGHANDDTNGHTNSDTPLRQTEGKGEKAKTTWHITDDLVTDPTTDPDVQYPVPAEVPKGFGQRLRGTNYDNMAHIRSGQCWNQCATDEAAAYEAPGGLQEKLMKGMTYLWENAEDTGTLGLRWLRNVVDEDSTATNGNGHIRSNNDTNGSSQQKVRPINETCGAGFFRNLKDLEKWSSTHPSHMAIFAGAHKHARDWGKDRKFMTWHEVSVLKKGEARWEYVNCDPRTGVVRFVKMGSVEGLGGKGE